MPEKNPFVVLGFAPHAFTNLSDEDIRSLVKAQHRALAVLHHPDRRSGNSARFKEVQDSYDLLQEDSDFQYWKNVFLRPRKDQISELRKALAAAHRNATGLQESLVAFWQALSEGRKVFRGEQQGHYPHLKELGEPSGFSVFNPPSATLIMIDQLEIILKKQAAREKERVLPWSDTGECFSLYIAEDGSLTRQRLVKTVFDAKEGCLPAVRKELIELRELPAAKSYYWRADGEPAVLGGVKLLGSIDKKYFEEEGLWKSTATTTGLIPTDVHSEDFRLAREGYRFDEFEKFFRLIKPCVETHQLLVAVAVSKEQEPYIKILGHVRLLLDVTEDETRDNAVK